MRYTARRKRNRGLVAAYKHMQAERMSLHATASDCVITPPAEKFDQNPHYETKPQRHPLAVSAQTQSYYV